MVSGSLALLCLISLFLLFVFLFTRYQRCAWISGSKRNRREFHFRFAACRRYSTAKAKARQRRRRRRWLWRRSSSAPASADVQLQRQSLLDGHQYAGPHRRRRRGRRSFIARASAQHDQHRRRRPRRRRRRISLQHRQNWRVFHLPPQSRQRRPIHASG